MLRVCTKALTKALPLSLTPEIEFRVCTARSYISNLCSNFQWPMGGETGSSNSSTAA